MTNEIVDDKPKTDFSSDLQRFMSLTYKCLSPESKLLTEEIAASICAISDRKYGVTKKLKEAVAAILADLLAVASKPTDFSLYRSRGVKDFRGQRIGYRPAIAALDGMMELDYLFHRPGVWGGSNGQSGGEASSYGAKSNLIAVALRFGITPGNWRKHFERAPRWPVMAHPVMVRAKRQFWDDDEATRSVPMDKAHPAYIDAARQVDRINRYMAPQVITGCNHDGFIRIYSHGDQPGFAYNMAGRLYSKAAGVSYQNMEKHKRHGMRINGEPVVELDLRASFLTIYYGLNGMALDPATDPYAIGNLPREVVKAWVSMNFGYNRFHAKWSDETAKKLLEDYDIDLVAHYPVDEIREIVLNRHPLLSHWTDSKYRWPHLQYLESCTIIDAVEHLAFTYDIAALPLHDALLIPQSAIEVASSVLNMTFESVVGFPPVLKAKSDWPAPKRRKEALAA